MTKQILKVDVNDFAQVVSCVGFMITLFGSTMPDGSQKDLAINMGDNLIDILFKYSSDDKREQMEQIHKILLTEEADTSVTN